ncbi:MAG: PHB depolymerase family esterase [Planctomycetota bacterium]
MNRRRLIAALVAVTALAVAALFLLPTPPPAVDVSTHTIVVDDVERSYRIAVPHDLPTPAPVVFAFHGIGDSSDSMASYSQLDSLASDHGFLLVYPTGLNAMWAAIDVDPDALDDNRDVRFFDAALEQLATQYSIDRARLYLTGMSNGASFAQLLANARSSEVAAVVACSGPRPRALHDAQRPFPVLLIVGADDLASGSMQSDLDYYQSAGHDAKLVSVRSLGHAWSTHNNADLWSFLGDRRLSP